MSSIEDANAIGNLSYKELQTECRKANLSAVGSTQVLRKRLRGWLTSQKRAVEENAVSESGDSRPTKRTRSAADDLLCPITLELPFDPVTAEDGRVYERSAITTHIESRTDGQPLKSPITNEPMGPRLLPAVQTKSLIETLIETGTIEGDLAVAWKKKEQEKKEFDELVAKAEEGDAEAMIIVSARFFKGEGVVKNEEVGYSWLKKSAYAGNIDAMFLAGKGLLLGHVVSKNTAHGVNLLTMAAEGGSNSAAFFLGCNYVKGIHAFPKDTVFGKHWLCKLLEGDLSGIDENLLIEARSMLEEIEDE